MGNPEWEEWLGLEREMLGMRFYPWFGFHGNSAVNKKYLIVRDTGSNNGFVRENPRFVREIPREKSYIAKNNGSSACFGKPWADCWNCSDFGGLKSNWAETFTGKRVELTENSMKNLQG